MCYYVHNMVENSQNSKLIDFGLMDMVGVVYPVVYNGDLPECHGDTKPICPENNS